MTYATELKRPAPRSFRDVHICDMMSQCRRGRLTSVPDAGGSVCGEVRSHLRDAGCRQVQQPRLLGDPSVAAPAGRRCRFQAGRWMAYKKWHIV